MKNKVGMPKNPVKIIKKPSAFGIWKSFLSQIIPNSIVDIIMLITTIPRLGTSLFLFILLPSLFKNMLPFTKVVLAKYLTKHGIPIRVNQNIIDDQYENSDGALPTPAIRNTIENPIVTPNQKTRFHNLSLVNHLTLVGLLGNLLSDKFIPIKPPYNRFISSSLLRIFITNPISDLCSYRTIIADSSFCIKQIVLTLSTIILLSLPNVVYAATSTTKTGVLELIKHAEQENHIPSGLLLAVVTVESKLQPFALNIAGRSLFFKNKDTALQAIRQALNQGITNIDIGISQINYKWHQHNFTSLEAMISPKVNIKYAAELLAKLKQDYGDWHTAIRHYHSFNPEHHRKYSRKIVLCWLENH